MFEDSLKGVLLDIALHGKTWRENDRRSGSRSGVGSGTFEKRRRRGVKGWLLSADSASGRVERGWSRG